MCDLLDLCSSVGCKGNITPTLSLFLEESESPNQTLLEYWSAGQHLWLYFSKSCLTFWYTNQHGFLPLLDNNLSVADFYNGYHHDLVQEQYKQDIEQYKQDIVVTVARSAKALPKH